MVKDSTLDPGQGTTPAHTHINGFITEVFDILWSHVERRLAGHQKHCGGGRSPSTSMPPILNTNLISPGKNVFGDICVLADLCTASSTAVPS